MRKYFIYAGIGAAVVFSILYLWLNFAGMSVAGTPAPPDPVWVRFVNVMLICFACIFQGSLLGRFVDWLRRRR